jgi:hypothetical protein
MKKIAFAALTLAVLASSSAFAQGKTRAEVYQELIQAQQSGLNFVSDTSYPDVSPVFAQQVAHMAQQATDASQVASGTSTDYAN